MTADAGRVFEGAMAWLRKLRDQWLLLVFFAGAAFWARDTVEEFRGLPDLVRAQAAAVEELAVRTRKIEAHLSDRAEKAARPVLGFPGRRHSVADARLGEWTVVRFRPVAWLRDDCVAGEAALFVGDADGRWFSVPSRIARLPVLPGEAEIGFDVRIPVAMRPGRALLRAEFPQDCATGPRIDTAPVLPFRVLP